MNPCVVVLHAAHSLSVKRMNILFSMTKSHFDRRSRRPGLRRRGTEDVRGRGRRAGEMEASGIRSDRSMCAVFLEISSSSSFFPGEKLHKKLLRAASACARIIVARERS